MLVELYHDSGLWAFKDVNGISCVTTFTTATYIPAEVKELKSKTKIAIKLKEAGFTSDEIIEMTKEGVI